MQTTLNDDIAVFHLQLTFKYAGIWRVTDGYEDAFEIEFFSLARFAIFDAHAGNAHVVTQHFIELAVPANSHVAVFRFIKQLIGQNLLTTEAVTTVNNNDFGGNVREVKCLFNGGVTTTNHGDTLFAVEETVTGGTR